ncbi:hypothetical protein AAF712_010685 [Marasmius tenuissimus]|uniref:Uncharacterized protein n=1 Tax=Marasmius tenuissimus TaxID=585030 RepID=A0ABR2ZM95_9AGAR
MAEEDADANEVTSRMWDALDVRTQEHWEKVAAEGLPMLENQKGFVAGIQAIIQSCLQSGHLGHGGVAVLFCFDKEKTRNSVPVTVTSMINEWSDPSADIPDTVVLPAAASLCSALHENLAEVLKKQEVQSLKLKNNFTLDGNHWPCFPQLSAEDPSLMVAHTILQEWFQTLWELYKLWWYPEDYSDKIKEHRIILPIPLDAEREAILRVIFQQFFLSRHRSIYWGYVIRYDMIQDEIYLCEDTFDHFIPHNARSVINMVAKSIARVGFLDFKTAHTPGAVNAWIDAVVSCAECPAPPKLDYTKLSFFKYSPVMVRNATPAPDATPALNATPTPNATPAPDATPVSDATPTRSESPKERQRGEESDSNSDEHGHNNEWQGIEDSDSDSELELDHIEEREQGTNLPQLNDFLLEDKTVDRQSQDQVITKDTTDATGDKKTITNTKDTTDYDQKTITNTKDTTTDYDKKTATSTDRSTNTNNNKRAITATKDDSDDSTPAVKKLKHSMKTPKPWRGMQSSQAVTEPAVDHDSESKTKKWKAVATATVSSPPSCQTCSITAAATTTVAVGSARPKRTSAGVLKALTTAQYAARQRLTKAEAAKSAEQALKLHTGAKWKRAEDDSKGAWTKQKV